jgi:AraC family transcriptional regulator
MQVQSYSALARSEKMRFSLRASSVGRCWSGIEAVTYDISAGVQEKPATAHHGLVMHLGSAVSGMCRCGGPAVRRLMQPGDIDLIPAGYGAMWQDDAPGRVLNVRLSPVVVQRAADSMQRGRSNAIPPRLQTHDPILQHLGWALVGELENGIGDDRLFAESIGDAVAVQLLQRYSGLRPVSVRRGLSRSQLVAVQAYIHERLTERLSLVELAAVVSLSPSHFKALFKMAAGVPVHQYVIRCRVERAVSLIAHGNRHLCDVAQRCGFAHQSHMTRCMRRTLGFTPATLLRDVWDDAAEGTEV